MSDIYVCTNSDCSNTTEYANGGNCPTCGKPLEKEKNETLDK